MSSKLYYEICFYQYFYNENKKNAKIVMHNLYLSKHMYVSKLFTIVYNLPYLSLKNCWLFPTMYESHRKVESKPTSMHSMRFLL